MWLSASFEQQRRFIRHLRPWRDVHRHRLAPPVAARIAELRAEGRLRIEAGRLQTCRPIGGKLGVTWRRCENGRIGHLEAARLINCTGPQGDLQRTREPLIHLLPASGHIRADADRFGIEVNAQADDRRQWPDEPAPYGTRPDDRGAFRAIVAMPELSRQTWAVARRLSNAQWVEGAGL